MLFLPANTDKSALFYLIVLLLLGSLSFQNMYTIDEAGFPVLVSLYVGVGFERFLTARLVPNGLVVLIFGLFIVWATDIGAYMVGRRFGCNKLWPGDLTEQDR